MDNQHDGYSKMEVMSVMNDSIFFYWFANGFIKLRLWKVRWMCFRSMGGIGPMRHW